MDQPLKRWTVSRKDAFIYIDTIRRLTANEPHLYPQFAEYMRRYLQEIVDITDVIAYVEVLFMHHPLLLQIFKVFLPPGYTVKGGISLAAYRAQVAPLLALLGSTETSQVVQTSEEEGNGPSEPAGCLEVEEEQPEVEGSA
ncbi:hypothetical protein BDY19DRAFT_945258 [Irpex rosettiformis]|uniref:Uncharacterized protein n=1 Tax=Irpex rosettiformis TaxID=378272 RepID=A0ACB8U553_9APHY|nr:hypothetical protein BDY19DRAFT_945258 [Irpex rosettiformis]